MHNDQGQDVGDSGDITRAKFGSREAGRLGGKARAKALTKSERESISRHAADKRWGNDLPQATHDGVIELAEGKVQIECAVLETGRRLLTQEGFLRSIGRASKAKAGTGSQSMVDGLPPFLAAENLKPFIAPELQEATNPVIYRTTRGQKAFGFDATLLPQVCEVYLLARDEGKLHPGQGHIAKACEMLMRSLAKVGIVALVDEATGYQAYRARDALERLLEQYISEELRRWVKTFPDDYVRQLCRLRGVEYKPNMQMPRYFGHLTNDIVYKRLAPGVLEKLREVNPANAKGQRAAKHHQHLSTQLGNPKLIEHMGTVVGVMKLSDDYDDFHKKLDRVLPKPGDSPLFEQLKH